MSDTEDVPELSAEAKAFLTRHQATGEPSAEGLERGRQRVVSLARGAPSSRRRRPLLPPEVMAAAAVVIVLLGAQGMYLVFRTPPVAEVKPDSVPSLVEGPVAVMESGELEVKAISAAWTAGDLDSAGRLASRHCQSGVCRPLATELTRALGLAARVDTLLGPELDELAAFDGRLSQGSTSSAVRDLVAKRRLALTTAGDELSRLTLAVGATGQVTADRDIARLAIGSPDIADVSVDGLGTIQVKGMAVGKTTLLVWFAKGGRMSVEVEVLEQGPSGQTLSLHGAQPELEPEVELPGRPPGVGASDVRLALGGATQVTTTGKITRIAVGDPGIAEVSVNGKSEIRLEGKSLGRTTVLVWFADGERQSLLVEVKGPHVDPPQKEEVVQLPVGGNIKVALDRGELRKVIGGNPEIARVSIVNKELRIEGVRPGMTMVVVTYTSDERQAVNIEVTQTRDDEVDALFTRAFQAKSGNNPALALKLLQSVLRLEPDHTGALHLVHGYRNEARDAYLRGYQLRDTRRDEAIELFKQVMALTLPSDETHQKAKVRIAELQK